MGVAIYIRTSTEEQNPYNQLKECENICPAGYVLYKDQQSAWKEEKERPGFKDLRTDIKSNKIDDLYVWDLDRIYRNRKKLVEFFQFCKMYKCKVHSVRQAFFEQIHNMPEPFNEAMHDFMLHIMGWMAEDESKKKSMRVRAAIRVKEDGAYSYKGNKWGRKQVSTFKKNQIMKLREDGLSIRNISKELNISIGAVHKYLLSN